jgi:D-glycero-alpha-D-manno-heptose-7-phosphate kinase
MIITKAPLRLTFGGAPTDIPSYSNQFGGFCISAAIDKYCYITLNKPFYKKIFLKYSKIEEINNINEINNLIFKECIKYSIPNCNQIEISSISDIPSDGSGLGGSSSFCVSLLKALYSYKKESISQEKIAQIACDISINKLKKNQGKQDEYASALGGINYFEFDKNGNVNHNPLNIFPETLEILEDNLLLFYSNLSHNSEDILKDQKEKTINNDIDMINNLHEAKQIGIDSKKALEKGDLNEFSYLLNFQWSNKKERSNNTTNEFLDKIHYDLNKIDNGGNKIIGSGGGGFIMVYSENKYNIRRYMKNLGLIEMKFNFDFSGVQRII